MKTSTPLSRRTCTHRRYGGRARALCRIAHLAKTWRGAVIFPAVSEERNNDKATARDRAATRRDVDAGVRDRMAGDEMPDGERDARSHAARDRMAAMQDRRPPRASATRTRRGRRRRRPRDATGDA